MWLHLCCVDCLPAAAARVYLEPFLLLGAVPAAVAPFVIVMEHADNVELTAIDAVGNELGVPVPI